MKLRNGREIAVGMVPYVVAELNSSHYGKLAKAKDMIASAKECGCDAVKLQSWTAESLYAKNFYDANPISKRMFDRFSLSPDDLKLLSEYCQDVGIDFSSTPYSEQEADFLIDECNAPFVKIASMDINNLPFIRHIAARQVPIVLSTGMASIEEIEKAAQTVEEAGNDNLCILHCVSIYPVELADVNLNNVMMLREKFPQYEVGYSDHTFGAEAACGAVAMGAVLIEKHFTLDNKHIGMDNQMATEPAEMKMLVDACHKVFAALGSSERILSDAELVLLNI